MDHELYMRQALELAKEAAREGEVPVGAVVVCKGRVIARGHNLTETLTDVTVELGMELTKLGDNPFAMCVVEPFFTTWVSFPLRVMVGAMGSW